ncbi:alpha/beta hydrolase [Rhizobium sp. ICMP 5592]|uniref:alpha/beta fold hydrolase n=1 Tax=Rhizobium sp. ICMP 5592 TaxID=2292445 RepID=UPI001296857C|nr:alpha/beta hydrolase [Rhizobium sp. ICMP 5592]MQB46112.1 alpha/beta fold hydrolase [Rhizobium sp. ICMP 5592]
MTAINVTAESKTLTAFDHRTNYHDAGEGAPVVLLHGSGAGVSAWANWNKVFPVLAQGFRVVAPDIAGFGMTELKPDARYDIKLWVAHFVAILDELGLERVSVVGNSFGGALGLATALSNPDRIDKLVLLGTPCGEFPMTDGLRAQLEFDGTIESMRRAVSYFPYDDSIITEELIQRRLEAATRAGALEAFRKLMPAPQGDDRPTVRGIPVKALKMLEHNALILHGRDDRVVPFDCAVEMHGALKNSQLHSFGCCGHWVQIEREAAFLKLVTDFLN